MWKHAFCNAAREFIVLNMKPVSIPFASLDCNSCCMLLSNSSPSLFKTVKNCICPYAEMTFFMMFKKGMRLGMYWIFIKDFGSLLPGYLINWLKMFRWKKRLHKHINILFVECHDSRYHVSKMINTYLQWPAEFIYLHRKLIVFLPLSLSDLHCHLPNRQIRI